MKRKLPQAKNPKRKRRKITEASDLEKVPQVRKDIKLKGKARLRLKIKEQSICIEQKNSREEQLLQDLERAKNQERRSAHILGVIDQYWKQVTNDLDLIITDFAETSQNSTDDDSFYELPSATVDFESNSNEDGDEIDEETNRQIEERVKKTKNSMEKLSEIVVSILDSQTKIWTLVGQKGADEQLRQGNTKLRAQTERLRQEVQNKHSELANKKKINKEQEELVIDGEKYIRWLEDQNERIATAYKRLLRTHLYNKNENKQNKTSLETNNQPINSIPEAVVEEDQSESSLVESQATEIETLKQLVKEDKAETVRLQNEKIEMKAAMDAKIKQFNAKDVEIRVLKSDKELTQDLLHQTKASHESSMSILQGSFKKKVEELEKRAEEQTKKISLLQIEKGKLTTELGKINLEEMKLLVTGMEDRDGQQKKVVEQLRNENKRMREQLGNRDLYLKLKEFEGQVQIKDVEIKELKKLIQKPEIYSQAMYKAQINRLKHQKKRLEGEITELKATTQAKKLHSLENTMEVLGAEVDRAALEYSQLQKEKDEKISEFLNQIKELTETNSKLKWTHAQTMHKLKRLSEEKSTLGQTVETHRTVQTKQKVYINSLKEQSKTLSQRNDSLRNTINTSQQAAQALRDNLISLTQKYYYVKTEMERESEVNSTLKVSLETKQNQINQLTLQLHSLHDKYAALRTKNHKLKQAKTQGGSGMLEDQILKKQVEIAEGKLICSLCTHNEKDTIITKCLHMFCRSCINNHFLSRNRRCPQCKCAFGRDDMKDVSFNFN